MKILRILLLLSALGLFSLPAFAESVNINSADAATLATNLKGIGPKSAEAIVKYRKQHGPFRHINELAKVKGIGSKTIAKNRDTMTVGAQPKSGFEAIKSAK